MLGNIPAPWSIWARKEGQLVDVNQRKRGLHCFSLENRIDFKTEMEVSHIYRGKNADIL
jgi:hypothetical protein